MENFGLMYAGVEARHICRISGHKSNESLKSYTDRLSEEQARKISSNLSALTTVVATAVEPNDNETDQPSTNISTVPTAVLVDDDVMFDDTIDEVMAEMLMPTSS